MHPSTPALPGPVDPSGRSPSAGPLATVDAPVPEPGPRAGRRDRRPDTGAAWCSRRWIRALESLDATYPNPRLPRGRTLARKGAVRKLEVRPGEAAAEVEQGPRIHRVVLRLPRFTDEEWSRAIEAVAGRPEQSAELLTGRLPEDIDGTLAATGPGLFPRRGELSSGCTCKEAKRPCAHGAAVHYALAEALADNPFLLTALRGRRREELLAGLRALHTGEPDPEPGTAAGPVTTWTAADELPRGTAFFAAGEWDAVTPPPGPRAPDDPAAWLRGLGAPPGGTPQDAEMLAVAVEQAALFAWRTVRGPVDAAG